MQLYAFSKLDSSALGRPLASRPSSVLGSEGLDSRHSRPSSRSGCHSTNDDVPLPNTHQQPATARDTARTPHRAFVQLANEHLSRVQHSGRPEHVFLSYLNASAATFPAILAA